ncbi:MAG TPA: hypothetical protein PL196_12230, partial [Burkholderiaceae bacterium]|nr:hypothetical protein [Burkholderiaceae bacterium]
RDALRALAAAEGVRFVLVERVAPEAVLRERIAQRLREDRDASDADVAVLDLQLRVRVPVAPEEVAHALSTEGDLLALQRRCAALAAELQAAPAPHTPESVR